MKKLIPVNNHLLIEPIKHEAFIASQKDTYEEIGVVIAVDPLLTIGGLPADNLIGGRVYFDSWLAAKFPKEGTDEHYWLVKWEDVRAVEEDYAEQEVPA